MKSAVCFAAVLALLLTLSACGKANDNSDSDSLDAPAESTTAESAGSDEEETLVGSTAASEETDAVEIDADSAADSAAGEAAFSAAEAAYAEENQMQDEYVPEYSVCYHNNTEIRDARDATVSSEGYTGDIYCRDCGALLGYGSPVPELRQTVFVSHDNYDMEMQIFNCINAEREKAGIAPLAWDENLYAAAKIRAKEYSEYLASGGNYGAHKRPNGDSFFSAVEETSGYDQCNVYRAGENLVYGPADTAVLIECWMDSQPHRENILRSDYTQAALAVYIYDGVCFAANIFIG